MTEQIALLRGINVGGNNKITVPDLKTAFEDAGFSEVRTYINSGNVIFPGDGKEGAALQQKCRQAIMDKFQLAIPVSILSATELSDALGNAPAWWDNGKDSKHNAIFTIAPASAADVVKTVGEAKPEYEKRPVTGGSSSGLPRSKHFQGRVGQRLFPTPLMAVLRFATQARRKSCCSLPKENSP